MLEISEIYCEDCLSGMRRIPEKSIDLILQDPPYNMVSCDFEWDIMTKIDEFWLEWKRIIKDNAAIVMTASQPFTSKLVMSNLEMFKYEWIWVKNRGSGHLLSKSRPLRHHENIIVFGNKLTFNPIREDYADSVKKRLKNGNITINRANHISTSTIYGQFRYQDKFALNPLGACPSSVQMFDCVKIQAGKLHPTQKPVTLFEYLIRTYTNESDIVFDGFLGSGTTAVACINTNRNYIGFEISEDYFNIAQQRIKDAKAQLRLF